MKFENFEKNTFESGSRENSLEKKLETIGKYHYIYKDNFENGKIIFECNADNILEADEEMERQTGIIPAKHSNIACSFEKNL